MKDATPLTPPSVWAELYFLILTNTMHDFWGPDNSNFTMNTRRHLIRKSAAGDPIDYLFTAFSIYIFWFSGIINCLLITFEKIVPLVRHWWSASFKPRRLFSPCKLCFLGLAQVLKLFALLQNVSCFKSHLTRVRTCMSGLCWCCKHMLPEGFPFHQFNTFKFKRCLLSRNVNAYL